LCDLIAAHQLRRDRQHHRSLISSAVNFRDHGVCVGLNPRAGMQHTNIDAKIDAQILDQRLQNSPIAAVTVDDREIPRRQSAGNFAAQIPHE